jgi:hypothetical protein
MTGTPFTALLPGPQDRAAFVGQTGSGKTTLARLVCEQRDYCVAHDAKGFLDWPGWRMYRTLRQMSTDPECPPHVIYRPGYGELMDADIQNAFFEWVYRRERTTVYIDELSSITRGDVYPYYFGACITRGREKGVSVFSATQRPTRIPQIVFSESEHVYAFRLKMPRDRERIAEMCGIDDRTLAALRGHEFLYAPQADDVTGPFVLNLKGGQ